MAYRAAHCLTDTAGGVNVPVSPLYGSRNMLKRLFVLAAAFVLVGAAPVSGGTASRESVHARAANDLDWMTPADIERDLRDEVDDIMEGHTPGELVEVDELFSEIVEALGDDGDTGYETAINMEDLVEEFAEAGTCVNAVVQRVLQMDVEPCDGELAHASDASVGVRGPSVMSREAVLGSGPFRREAQPNAVAQYGRQVIKSRP